MKVVLLDANVLASHYAPISGNARVVHRATRLLTGGGPNRVSFFIPDFCVAEVFAVFEKYRWGSHWQPKLKNRGVRLTPKEFEQARNSFRDAISNGRKVFQYHLNRYHILCTDLISPINAAYQIERKGKNKGKPNARPAGAIDMLIIAMGIWLSKQFGRENVVIITADTRVARVARRAASAHLGKDKRNHLEQVATSLGMVYGPNIYPRVLNLSSARNSEIAAEFPHWNPSWT